MDGSDTPSGTPVEMEDRVRVATARDSATAEQWWAVLTDAGIDALVEIDDDRNTPGGNSPFLSGYIGPRFVYPVSVLPEDRERAAATLIDHGWNGGQGNRQPSPVPFSTMLRGALIVTGISIVLMLLLLMGLS